MSGILCRMQIKVRLSDEQQYLQGGGALGIENDILSVKNNVPKY